MARFSSLTAIVAFVAGALTGHAIGAHPVRVANPVPTEPPRPQDAAAESPSNRPASRPAPPIQAPPQAPPPSTGAAPAQGAVDEACEDWCKVTMALSGCELPRDRPANVPPEYAPEAVAEWLEEERRACPSLDRAVKYVDCDEYPCLLFLDNAEGQGPLDLLADVTCSDAGPALQASHILGLGERRYQVYEVMPEQSEELLDPRTSMRVQAFIEGGLP